MNGINIVVGVITSVIIGMNFGMWMQDINAGITAYFVTWTAFKFKYDEN